MAEAAQVSQLSAVFPEIEQDVLSAMLAHHGSVEGVVEALLDDASATVGGTQVDTDEDLAREMQEGLDQEIAQALQQELNVQRANESTAPQSPLASAAADRMAAVAGGTKRLFQPLLNRAVKQLSSRNRGGNAERLLDEATQSETYNETLAAPLASPLFSPQYAAPTPPPMAPMATSSTRAADPATPAQPSVARTETPTEDGFDSSPGNRPNTPPGNKYASRVERARLANRTTSVSRMSATVPLPATLAPLVAPPATATPIEVPVGELI